MQISGRIFLIICLLQPGETVQTGETVLRQDSKVLRELEYGSLTVNLYEHEETQRTRHVRFASDLDDEQVNLCMVIGCFVCNSLIIGVVI